MSGLYALLVMRAALRLIESDALLVLRWMPRVLGATLAMAVAVRMAQAALPPVTDALSAAMVFGGSGLVGAAVYPPVLLALWWMAGKPMGPEASVVALVGKIAPRLARG
jgi:hypothetical protein